MEVIDIKVRISKDKINKQLQEHFGSDYRNYELTSVIHDYINSSSIKISIVSDLDSSYDVDPISFNNFTLTLDKNLIIRNNRIDFEQEL